MYNKIDKVAEMMEYQTDDSHVRSKCVSSCIDSSVKQEVWHYVAAKTNTATRLPVRAYVYKAIREYEY